METHAQESSRAALGVVDQELVDAAVALARARGGGDAETGAAAMRLSNGAIVTSVAPPALNSAVQLCHETGAFCEAYKRGENVVASICVSRPEKHHEFWVLAPCGVCQERLMIFGPDVAVGVPAPENPTQWSSVRLRDVQPHWWGQVFPEEGYAWPQRR